MLVVVLGHSGISLMQHPLPGLIWHVTDGSRSVLFDYLLGWMRFCCIPLFLVVAGYLSARQLQACGVAGFLRLRSLRLLLPLVLASLLLLPLVFFIWSLGWLISGQCTVVDIRRLDFRPEIQSELFGFAHLWFLAYLYLYCLIYAFGRRLAHWAHIPIGPPKPPDSVHLLFLAIPVIVLVELKPEILGVFHNSFIPAPWPFLFYGCFYFFGVALWGKPGCLRNWVGNRWIYLAASQAVYAVLWIVFPGYAGLVAGGIAGRGTAALFGLFAVLSIPAWFGLFGSLKEVQSPWVHYLAEASYWVYLVHIPLVGLLQIGCLRLDFPAELKFLIISSVTLAASLWTYQLWVRSTVLERYVGAGGRSIRTSERGSSGRQDQFPLAEAASIPK